jgi:hypothetical protein
MNKICKQCKAGLESNPKTDYIVTDGICSQCIENIFNDQENLLTAFINNIDAPILLMQPDPRQVRTANKKACELFDKDLSQIEGHRGGQVFDCEHAFTEAGCGKDENCEDCKIKNSVVETFSNGKSFNGVSTVLDIKINNSFMPFTLQVSTEKIGNLALIKIDEYEKKA